MINKQKIDWQGYEAITKYIHEILGTEYGIKIIGSGKTSKVTGQSGVSHQIDVLTEQSEGTNTLQTAIECKYWNKKISKDTIMKLWCIMDDANIAKGIVVSKAAFTPDALKYAGYKDIKLIHLREIHKKDLNGNHTLNLGEVQFNIKSTLTRPTITNIDIGSAQIYIRSVEEFLSVYYATILTPQGKQIPFHNYTGPFQKYLKEQNTLLKIFTKSYTPPAGDLIIGPHKIPIEKMAFTGALVEEHQNTSQTFTITDQVWMIMENIFENRIFWLSENGMIYRVP